MNYYIYVLKSKSRNWLYIGMTDNIDRRIDQHQNGYSKSTAPRLFQYLILWISFIKIDPVLL